MNAHEKLIRPTKCFFCNALMFYAGDERHEPEVSVGVTTCTSATDLEDPTKHFGFYAHVRCWNEKIGSTK